MEKYLTAPLSTRAVVCTRIPVQYYAAEQMVRSESCLAAYVAGTQTPMQTNCRAHCHAHILLLLLPLTTPSSLELSSLITETI
jgi:hypothetical protein